MRAAKVQASLRIRAVSPEPSLLAHTSSESRGTFRQKARSLAPLNGWACAVKVCHDGMLEDTNSLDGAQLSIYVVIYQSPKTLKLTLLIILASVCNYFQQIHVLTLLAENYSPKAFYAIFGIHYINTHDHTHTHTHTRHLQKSMLVNCLVCEPPYPLDLKNPGASENSLSQVRFT